MSAMTPGTGTRNGNAHAMAGVIVPRFLRKPLRLMMRVASGQHPLPRGLGVAATAVFLGATGLYGAVLGGHTHAIVQAVTSASGFAIDEIVVSGHRETSEIDVLGQIGLDGSTSLIGFDVAEARKRISELPWVADAGVRKIYPNKLQVSLVERNAFAVWQHGSRLSIVDVYGQPITGFSGGKFASLPLVVGFGAEKKAAEFVGLVAKYPQLSGRVTGYIRVADRRWDLRLENGMTIRLPEIDQAQALARVVELDEDHGLLSRDVEVVDMRVADRFIVKLSPDAAISRQATMKKRMESRAPGRRI